MKKRACCLLNVVKMAVAIIWPKIGNGYSFLCKLKATGMLLRDIKRYAQLRYNGDGTIAERLELFAETSGLCS